MIKDQGWLNMSDYWTRQIVLTLHGTHIHEPAVKQTKWDISSSYSHPFSACAIVIFVNQGCIYIHTHTHTHTHSHTHTHMHTHTQSHSHTHTMWHPGVTSSRVTSPRYVCPSGSFTWHLSPIWNWMLAATWRSRCSIPESGNTLTMTWHHQLPEHLFWFLSSQNVACFG